MVCVYASRRSTTPTESITNAQMQTISMNSWYGPKARSGSRVAGVIQCSGSWSCGGRCSRPRERGVRARSKGLRITYQSRRLDSHIGEVEYHPNARLTDRSPDQL